MILCLLMRSRFGFRWLRLVLSSFLRGLFSHAREWAFRAGLAAIATYYFWSENPFESLEYWYLALLSIICWLITWYWYLRRHHDLQLTYLNPVDGYFMQEQCLGISKSGLSFVRTTSSENYQWSAIKAVHYSDRLFFLHLDPAQTICVPQRAFSSPTEAEHFISMVKENIGPNG
jgi:hypothetical protein